MNTTRRNLLVGGLFAAGGGALSYRLFQKSHPNALPSPFQLLSPLPDELELPAIQMRILGQTALMAGALAAIRIILTSHATGKPIKGDVEISLASLDGKQREAFHFKSDESGSLDARFKTPKWAVGEHNLTVKASSSVGSDVITRKVTLTETSRLMLTSDKPVYQPGQMIHLRTLALDEGDRTALDGKTILFEVEDGRGNKVFKKREKLSKFGVSGVDFQLADEVNMGSYTLRAIVGKEQTEKQIRVERYVLPKYKIEIVTAKSYYLPGEKLGGHIDANYFFGKPVDNAEVSIEVETADIGVSKLETIKGRTDSKGRFEFIVQLPLHFVGQSLTQGKGVVALKATVKDSADHRQEQNHSVSVVNSPLQVMIVPESRQLIQGVENRYFVLVSTPDGLPVKEATIKFWLQGNMGRVGEQTLKSDDSGFATAIYTPKESQWISNIGADVDAKGNKATHNQALNPQMVPEGVILRTDKSILKVGEKLQLTGICAGKSGSLFIDIIKSKQTIFTDTVQLKKGKAVLSFEASPDMAGTLEVHAYRILPSEEIVRDVRSIIVLPADDLKIKANLDQLEYKPGQEAKVQFQVTDSSQRPVACALGLAIVDESVFALSELQPGLERIYFTLEKELMEPKYEIHGLTPTGLIQEEQRAPLTENHQRMAGMILASFDRQTEFSLDVNAYQDKLAKIETKVLEDIQKKSDKLRKALQSYRRDTGKELTTSDSTSELVSRNYLSASDLKDPWGTDYKLETYGQKNYAYFNLVSAGPDKKFGTADDLNNPNAPGTMRDIVRRRDFGGGRFRAKAANMEVMAFAAPMIRNGAAPMKDMAKMSEKKAFFESDKTPSSSDAQRKSEAAPRVREFFPETMFWNPQLITDAAGRASLTVPMADSITTWRMSMSANSTNGQLGSDTVSIRVFQEFFIDLDLPVALTQKDQLRLPVAVYNYLSKPQTVRLKIDEQPWFKLQGNPEQSITLGANEVKVAYFPITAAVIGSHSLTVTAKGTSLSDAIKREIQVIPDGREILGAVNGSLESNVSHEIKMPGDAVVGGNSLFLKLYPGAFSTIVEGLDSIFQMPNGCFEQTSSTTYPNILVLDYLKTIKKLKPELQMKAEQYINVGYQRLVTFECKSGGFSWFGEEPAHQILTAYGLLEFSDMAKVYDIDAALIPRIQSWLMQKQHANGGWLETGHGIEEGIITRQTGELRSTAYIAWALAESGAIGEPLQKAISFVKQHLGEAKDPYTLAIILNLLTKVEKEGGTTAEVAEKLMGMAKKEGDSASWIGETQTFTGAHGSGADIEATGLAAFALAKWGRNPGFLKQALTYLTKAKDPKGTWNSTQATVWAMKALLFASSNHGAESGNIVVKANGQKVETVKLTKEDSDVMRQIDLTKYLVRNVCKVELEFDGKESVQFQLSSRHYEPWSAQTQSLPAMEPLALKVDYDKTSLKVNDKAKVTITIKNQSSQNAEMPLIDVGVPPGFEVVSEGLVNAVEMKRISKFTVAARQVILYLTRLKPGETVTVTYEVRAKFPLEARTPQSKAYPYYNPEKVTHHSPTKVLVRV